MMTRAKDPNAPNFFLLGAAKCGTTSLHDLLCQHPDIFMPQRKELHFFTSERYFTQGMGAYLREFMGAERFPLRGEGTPQYFHAPETVAPRLLGDLGTDLRFIVILRDPVERAWSHYVHMAHRYAAETRTFATAVEQEDRAHSGRTPAWTTYFSDGLYAKQLENWFRYYPRERFFLCLIEDMKQNSVKLARNIFHFLGVDPDAEVEVLEKRNAAARPRFQLLATLLNRPGKLASTGKNLLPYAARQRLRDRINGWNSTVFGEAPRMDGEIARRLRERYREDVHRLEQVLERDLSHWFG